MPDTKIATCCYCGTRAALSLRGRVRHELACSSCGAPLSRMKMLPKAPDGASARAATPARPGPAAAPRDRPPTSHERWKKKRKTKRLGRKVLEEIWDVIEDIFD